MINIVLEWWKANKRFIYLSFYVCVCVCDCDYVCVCVCVCVVWAEPSCGVLERTGCVSCINNVYNHVSAITAFGAHILCVQVRACVCVCVCVCARALKSTLWHPPDLASNSQNVLCWPKHGCILRMCIFWSSRLNPSFLFLTAQESYLSTVVKLSVTAGWCKEFLYHLDHDASLHFE